MKAVLIPAEGPITQPELDGGLEQLQKAVGGPIEAVPLPPMIPGASRATSYVNEEGKLASLPINHRASVFMAPGLFAGDYIAGNLLICGFNPHTGEHADLPAELHRHLEIAFDLKHQDPAETGP